MGPKKKKRHKYLKKAALALAVLVLFSAVAAGLRLYVTRDSFVSPLPVKLLIRDDSYGDGHFGAKRSGGRLHKGIDFSADVETPVFAAKGGIVREAGRKKGNGNYVVLSHIYGYRTYYCHLSKIAVKERQFVRAGDIIGYVGKTGNANYRAMRSHLHFEVHKDGVAQDPAEKFADMICQKAPGR